MSTTKSTTEPQHFVSMERASQNNRLRLDLRCLCGWRKTAPEVESVIETREHVAEATAADTARRRTPTPDAS